LSEPILRFFLFLGAMLAALCGPARAQFMAPVLQPGQLALVVNDDDAASVEVAAYYRQARNVPAANVVHVRIPGAPRKLDAAQFQQLKEQIDARLGPEIQAVLMVWTTPYAVECNSITAAYTLGLDSALCAKPCGPGKPSPYYNAPSRQPFKDLGLRPSMLLPITSVAAAKALIDRGVAAARPSAANPASAYFLVTSEGARNSRAPFFPPSGILKQQALSIKTLQADSISDVDSILLYETGMARVPKLDTLRFLPGALADHLTSVGGDLLGESQMSSLRWLDAGATASYGSVTEPCNYWQKFPHPQVLLRRYLVGDTALEAYWKSVAWPAQGLFIGEPLSAPYARAR
jgi:uncharacterized protein (TIGR03790 family)